MSNWQNTLKGYTQGGIACYKSVALELIVIYVIMALTIHSLQILYGNKLIFFLFPAAADLLTFLNSSSKRLKLYSL